MSGGHFHGMNFIEMAHEIDRLVGLNDSTDKDEYGDDVGRHYSPETILKLQETARELRRVCAMVHRVDYLVSCDDGEVSFHRRWNEEVPEVCHGKNQGQS